MGAGLVVSEMVTSDTRLWNTRKSRLRLDHTGEPEPRSVQIAGGDPDMMAEAAKRNADMGAQIIDINMGCPVKKVCNKAAGSALMRDETLVKDILTAVVNAVDIPVTLKIRTGWNPEQRNALTIARIAEDCGIQALAIHGRTRCCMYNGEAEYDTIAEVCSALSIPVIANGDITSPGKGKTGAGLHWRQGSDDWSCSTRTTLDISGNCPLSDPWKAAGVTFSTRVMQEILLNHLHELYAFYGETMGTRIARKHVGWYLQTTDKSAAFRKIFNQMESSKAQLGGIREYFAHLIEGKEFAACQQQISQSNNLV